MNFLEGPVAAVHENGEMDEAWKKMTGEFLDELISLCVVGLPFLGIKIKTITSLHHP